MAINPPPEPWHSFFHEVDGVLQESIVLHCIGRFVIETLYGAPISTADVDCISVIPVSQIAHLQDLAGEGTALHRKHGVYFQHVAIVTVPENYPDRFMEMFPTAYQRLRLLGLEAHDLALSKLERNSARDREDVKFLARTVPLNLAVLENRYRTELRPYLANVERHDLTLWLWREILEGR